MSAATEPATPSGTPGTPTSAAKSTTGRRTINWGNLINEGRALLALIVIIVVFSSLSSRFLTGDNLIIMTRHVAFNAIIALGMLLVILNGGIDLSVGSTAGLSGIVAGYLLKGYDLPLSQLVAYPPVWVVIVISLLIGMLVGLVNGILVTRFNVAPFIATLGMLYVIRGFAQLISNGETFTRLFGQPQYGNTGFVSLLHDKYLGIPFPIWVMVVLAIVFSLYLTRTPFGRWLYASGSNSRAAELSGVPVKRVQVRIYVLAGLCAAIVGLLLTADLSAATPNGGEGYELNAIAAVVIGGAALSGGRGNIRGTMIGAFVIGFLVDGLVLVGVSVFWQEVIKGAVIIFAVALDQVQQKVQKRRALRRVESAPPTTTSSGSATSPAAAKDLVGSKTPE